MNVYDAVMSRRSIRKFSQTPILREDLLTLADCARMAAYPANVQPLKFAVLDEPGQLERVAAIVSRCGSNVVSVLHDGSDPNMPISSCFLKLVLETRDHAQIEQIRQELTKEGFQLVAERV